MTKISVAVAGQALLHGPIDGAGAGALRDILQQADAAFVNLEATLETEGAWPTKTKTLHLTNAGGIASLKALGFDALAHANNHAFDLGPPGIARTRSVVESAGLQLIGSGMSRDEAAKPAFIQGRAGTVAVLAVDLGPQPDIVYASADRAGINPLRMRRHVAVPPAQHAMLRELVAALGDDKREAARAAVGYRVDHAKDLEVFGTEVAEGAHIESGFAADPADFAAFDLALTAARAQADIVAVAIHNHHWDPNWKQMPAWVADLSRRLIDRGADLIAGTGAPVLQGISFYKGKPILAGLGNLIFHTRRSETYDRQGVDVWTGAACRCVFDTAENGARVEILPVAVGRPARQVGEVAPAPVPLEGEAARHVFDAMTADLLEEDRARVVLIDPARR
ncbi:CapA family protein [Microvirga terricola]|uniref:CapA family protein n=1 Tax=Microvirga terricola TaxID=2719797 RepID=A0ABX0VGA2_9HYPH|nr:CapA family protein [Microvirga terricola]NIX78274.1 CapA family protein [Microvirga terricola]